MCAAPEGVAWLVLIVVAGAEIEVGSEDEAGAAKASSKDVESATGAVLCSVPEEAGASAASASSISPESGPRGVSDSEGPSEGGGCDSSESVGCVSPFRIRRMLGRV